VWHSVTGGGGGYRVLAVVVVVVTGILRHSQMPDRHHQVGINGPRVGISLLVSFLLVLSLPSFLSFQQSVSVSIIHTTTAITAPICSSIYIYPYIEYVHIEECW